MEQTRHLLHQHRFPRHQRSIHKQRAACTVDGRRFAFCPCFCFCCCFCLGLSSPQQSCMHSNAPPTNSTTANRAKPCLHLALQKVRCCLGNQRARRGGVGAGNREGRGGKGQVSSCISFALFSYTRTHHKTRTHTHFVLECCCFWGAFVMPLKRLRPSSG